MNLLDISRLLGTVCVGMRPEDALACPTGAAIDSRKVTKGDLFFCLSGEYADGHDFAEDAVKNGALAVIGTRDPFDGEKVGTPVLVVRNAADALAKIAAAHRARANGTVICVTGTSGKTSVKEALASVLSVAGETAKNPVNLNNQIGLPLSMLNASEDAAYWVMEAGISRPGDMDELGVMLRPDIALILNVGAGHVQELGDRGVPHHKARLLKYLMPDGDCVVSADYPGLVREAEAYQVAITRFSALNEDEVYFASYQGPEKNARCTFRLSMDGTAVSVSAPFLGAYGAENVAAIGAVAHILGMTAEEIADGFAAAELPGQRFALREAGEFLIIDDSYNANPLSMRRMLEAAAGMAAARGSDLVLVLGEMKELGPDSPEYHAALGRDVAELSPRALIWKGGYGEAVVKGLRDAGYAGPFTLVADAPSFTAAFTALGVHSGLVLFKGSRSNKLEELIAALTAMTGAETEKERADAL